MAKLTMRDVQITDEMWTDLGVQAAIEGKFGRGDIIRKACAEYLERTRAQRTARVSRTSASE